MSPIRAEQRALYPKDWKAISARIRERAGNRCECEGECDIGHDGRCQRTNGEPVPTKLRNVMRLDMKTGKLTPAPIRVTILTTAHLDHNPANCADDNLKSMCQRCHLRYDRHLHAENAAKTRDRKRAQLRFEADAPPRESARRRKR